MHYLITGGAGFIGSHLVDSLLARDQEVTVLDNFSTGRESNLYQHKTNKALKVIKGSILDYGDIELAVNGVDRILHLAAAVGVFTIMKDPIESIRTNIHGSENIFKAALRHSLPILLASTSEIYGKNNKNSLNEDDDRIIGAPQKLRWSYSDSKAIDESVAISLNLTSNLETRIVRLFNTVGPRQVGTYGMVVPRFVQAALHNEPLEIFGTGEQTRCFGHVQDIVEAILLIDQCVDAIANPINVGVSQEISIISLAQKIQEFTESKSPIIFRNTSDVYGVGFEDMQRRVPDNSKLKKLCNWIPKKNIDDIITDTVMHLRKCEAS